MAEPKKRPGSHARPPKNTSSKSPLAGVTINRVELLGLQETVRKLRVENGWGSQKIANHIQETMGIKVANMSVYRWYKDNVDNQPRDRSANLTVNTYLQELQMVKTIENTIDTINSALDEINGKVAEGEEFPVRDIKDLSITLEKLIARQQSLNASIGATQEKIYTYSAFSQIVNIMLEIAQSHGIDFYSEIKERIEANPMLAEGFRRIEADGKT